MVPGLVAFKPLIPAPNQPLTPSSTMNDSPNPQPEQAQALNTRSQVTHLKSTQFQFKSSLKFPASVTTNPSRYAEAIQAGKQTTFEIILLQEGNKTKYLFLVSDLPQQSCPTNSQRACQSDIAPARGNIAAIEFWLPGRRLTPGTYRFGQGKTSLTDVMINSRQLYSDPSHGKVGCQKWGAGTLTVKNVVYDAQGNLNTLEASLSRICEQTAAFPPLLPQDQFLQTQMENIKTYTYQADWKWQRLVQRSR